ncbi:Alpha/beta hydrolase fold-3 domain protein [Gloeothece citriformis PCC 7424]|uniref:Alpha/beta hydrolase fold-3 domain protein n=1 Tax=Gloeothece citriformis (strain PCC 7424) TaxID=65393 RepID=B7KJ54_GLOC7|nr:alpha/beta hydrolase [Gloeothece citriformis]ACK72138.1 Alpha/beta hydrolase fold-3 domain protein [Gloeothece citriformis PCC 7424]
MPLLPLVESYLEQLNQLPPVTQLSPEEVRTLLSMRYKLDPNHKITVGEISERLLPNYWAPINLRIYTPTGTPPFPIVVYFHGGGWVLGDLDMMDGFCRVLCKEAQCVVVSVDYRLAPEHKFPAAVEDAYAATLWVSRHVEELKGNPEKIAVAGDSAGGNLAAVVALMARDKGEFSLIHQLLIYPVTNYGFDNPSYKKYAQGYWLTPEDMIWYWQHYLPSPETGNNVLVSPLQAESLENLPPASIYTAEFDILRSEAESYADRLQQAGVPVLSKCCEGLIHGFLGVPILHPVTNPFVLEIAQNLFRALRNKS